ncbi:MAG: transcription antitermination factor NusB [Clostridiales bacterium]|nr:transcription antitermination factor NusB [Candidatus Crickella equi]
MTREEIREKTMQLIFQMDVAEEFDYEKLTPIEEDVKAVGKKQALATLEIIRDHIADIDEIIKANLDNWSLDRVAKTDLAILRNAIAEMKYNETIPNGVAINEAVNLAKKYGDDKSFAFVNSVLSKIEKSL